MSKSTTLYVGLDVHKDSVDIGVCDAPRTSPVRHLGTAGGCEPVTKALRRQISAGRRLHIVYEAGPCGYVLARPLPLSAGTAMWLLRRAFRARS